MDQHVTNEQEWNNPANWAGPVLCRCYSSKIDSRLWVPKSNPNLGWTVNFGHKYGLLTFIGLLACVPIVLIMAVLTIKSTRTH